MNRKVFLQLGIAFMAALLTLWAPQAMRAQAPQAAAAVYIVNDAGDEEDASVGNICDTAYNPDSNPPTPPSGRCTLRAALAEASDDPDTQDTIQFNLGSANPVIQTAGLYLDNVIIQGNSGGAVRVVIDGSQAESWFSVLYVGSNATLDSLVVANISRYATGLTLSGNGSVISNCYIGLAADGNASASQGEGIEITGDNNVIGGLEAGKRNLISGNRDNGIVIEGAASGNIIRGNYIGSDPSGLVAIPNQENGILVKGTGNVIGGTQGVSPGGACTGACNLISGNGYYGIAIEGSASATNIVQGNFIGVNASGLGLIPNEWGGISIYGVQSHHNLIGGLNEAERNLISGNGGPGITIEGEAHNNTIQGNYIGVDTTGMTGLGQADEHGIWLNKAHYNTIGALLATDDKCRSGCNLVSGNAAGIVLDTASTFNTLIGNFIGVNWSGSAAVPNQTGILIRDATDNTVGGVELGAGNLVGGNLESGIGISGPASARNRILGNWIGVNRYGQVSLGNAGHGIYVYGVDNKIGGAAPGEGNTIAFNQLNGVNLVEGGGWLSQHTSVLGNSIYHNGLLGINLGASGVTPNDPGDVDDGANSLQNFPLLSKLTRLGSSATITGALNSAALANYRIEFYNSPGCDASGYGEGKHLLGSLEVTTNAAGNASFVVIYPGVSAITALATGPLGDTSEFSNCLGPVVVNSTGDLPDADAGDGLCYTGRNTPQNALECTLRAAIQQANASAGADAISFDIPGGGTPLIQPSSALPVIQEALILDATAQPVSGRVQLDGKNAPAGASGLTLAAQDVKLIGFSITRFPANGVHIQGGGGHTIQGNWIGVGPDPSQALNNQGHGILIENSTGSQIGGSAPGVSNLISGNTGSAVAIQGAGSTANKVQGNIIGLAPNETTDKGNGGHGVLVMGGSENIIGGSLPGEGNRIAYNHLNGVTVQGAGVGNRILRNEIFNNEGLGIDLGNDGVTPNDVTDADGGPNNTQNYPVWKSLAHNQNFVQGVLSSVAHYSFNLQFFASTACDASGYGEGRELVGELSVTTNDLGIAEFTFNTTEHHERLLSVTATDPFGSTSEFSECLGVYVADVKIEHQNVKTRAWQEILPETGTVDGNQVKFTITIRNQGVKPEKSEVILLDPETGVDLPGGRFERTFPPGNTTFEYIWDSSGYAWEKDRAARLTPRLIDIQVLQFVPGFGERLLDYRSNQIKVRPKPVILVHGWWTNAESSWAGYEAIMQVKHPWWQGYAVGDGQSTGVMDTGNPAFFGNSIEENARILRDYTQRVREIENAWHVDIVAHSKGGLISRYYIQTFMPLRQPDGRPMVAHLLMLGTPNAGSPCAMLLPGFLELTSYHVEQIFNPAVQERHGVPFAVEAGRPNSFLFNTTCLKRSPGDGVVELLSAWALPYVADNLEVQTQHTAMTESQADFNAFVWPRLARTVAEYRAGVALADEAPLPLGHSSELADSPQVLLKSQALDLAPGQVMTLALDVPTASGLGLILAAGEALTSTLSEPGGQVVWQVDAGSDQANLMFRSPLVNDPAVGKWQVTLENAAAVTQTVALEARLEGYALQISLAPGERDLQNRLPIQVVLTHNGSPALGADVQVTLEGLEGGHDVLMLLDDGQHSDGAANDGMYGGRSGSLAADIYTVYAEAEWSGSQIATYAYAQAALADLAVAQSASAVQARVGQPLTYTLTISNTGPSNEMGVLVTDTLPAGVEVISILSSTGGGCAERNGLVICHLGLAAGEQASVSLVVIPRQGGALLNSVVVTGAALDLQPDNNHSQLSLPAIAQVYLPCIWRAASPPAPPHLP